MKKEEEQAGALSLHQASFYLPCPLSPNPTAFSVKPSAGPPLQPSILFSLSKLLEHFTWDFYRTLLVTLKLLIIFCYPINL